MDIIEKLLRTADAYNAQAAAIRASQRGGIGDSSEVTITVSTVGVIERVRFTSAAMTLSAAQLGQKFWTTYLAAVRETEQATIASVPPELLDAEAAVIMAERDPDDGAPGLRRMPPPNEATPWTDADLPDDREAVRTGRVAWPPGVPDGEPAEVMAALKREIQGIADAAESIGPQIERLRGHGEMPQPRVAVRAEVVASGVPTSVSFTSQALNGTPDELGEWVLQALEAAKADVAPQAEALWRQAGMTGSIQDSYPMFPEG